MMVLPASTSVVRVPGNTCRKHTRWTLLKTHSINLILLIISFYLAALLILLVWRPKKISMSEILNLKSYPPVFRQQYIGIQQNSGLDDTTEQIQEVVNDDAIPVLDFQCLDLGKLQEACEDWGLFRLVNHGIPLTLMSQLRDHSRNLFSLTFESKQELFTNPMSYFWGTTALTPTGAALSIGPQNINWVEGLNIPLSQLSLFQKENETLGSFRYSFPAFSLSCFRGFYVNFRDLYCSFSRQEWHRRDICWLDCLDLLWNRKDRNTVSINNFFIINDWTVWLKWWKQQYSWRILFLIIIKPLNIYFHHVFLLPTFNGNVVPWIHGTF